MLIPSATRPPILYALRTHEGAQWFLHTPGNVDHLLGCDVCIEGTRSEFAMIDVQRIWPVGAPRPIFWWERVRSWLLRRPE